MEEELAPGTRGGDPNVLPMVIIFQWGFLSKRDGFQSMTTWFLALRSTRLTTPKV